MQSEERRRLQVLVLAPGTLMNTNSAVHLLLCGVGVGVLVVTTSAAANRLLRAGITRREQSWMAAMIGAFLVVTQLFLDYRLASVFAAMLMGAGVLLRVLKHLIDGSARDA